MCVCICVSVSVYVGEEGRREKEREGRGGGRGKKAIKLMQVGCHKVIDISRAEQFTVWKRRGALA